MEPVSVILSALAAAGAKVGGEAVGDAYAGLKRLILSKFGGANPRLEQHLDDYVADQDTYAKPAEKALREVHADADQEIVSLAVEVLKQAEAAKPGVSGGLVGEINAQGGIVTTVGTVRGDLNIGNERSQ